MTDLTATELDNRDNDPEWVKTKLSGITSSLRRRVKNSHLTVDTVWYNPLTRRLWVSFTDVELAKAYPQSQSKIITAWRVIRRNQTLCEQLAMLVSDVKSNQESGVIRG